MKICDTFGVLFAFCRNQSSHLCVEMFCFELLMDQSVQKLQRPIIESCNFEYVYSKSFPLKKMKKNKRSQSLKL